MIHFTLAEFEQSTTATLKGIDNTMPPVLLPNLYALVTTILDPLRDAFGAPIIISSGYRCTELNRLVGGVKDSQHLTAEAADITSLGHDRRQNAWLALAIRRLNLPFDQLILYDNRLGGPAFIHVSHRYHGPNRRQLIEKK